MNLDSFERLWRSTGNDLPPPVQVYFVEDLMKTLKNRRDAFWRGMFMVGGALTVWTGSLAWAAFGARVVDVTQEWGAIALLVLCWLTYIKVVLDYRRHARSWPHTDATVPGAIAALLDENRTRRQRAKFLGLAFLAFGGILGVTLWQLYDVGKMTGGNVRDFVLVIGGILVVSVLIQAIVFFAVTRPEGARLQRMLEEGK